MRVIKSVDLVLREHHWSCPNSRIAYLKIFWKKNSNFPFPFLPSPKIKLANRSKHVSSRTWWERQLAVCISYFLGTFCLVRQYLLGPIIWKTTCSCIFYILGLPNISTLTRTNHCLKTFRVHISTTIQLTIIKALTSSEQQFSAALSKLSPFEKYWTGISHTHHPRCYWTQHIN